MNSTISKDDKFAFLFKTNAAFDLSGVKTVLEDLYGYENITEVEGCANFLTSWQTFSNAVSSNTPAAVAAGDADAKNTVFVFLVGTSDTSGLTDGTNSLPFVPPGPSLSSFFDGTAPLCANIHNNSEVHYVAVFDHCETLQGGWSYADNGTLLTPYTAGDSMGALTHQAFLDAWIGAMSLNDMTLLNSEKLLRIEKVAQYVNEQTSPAATPLSTILNERKEVAGVSTDVIVDTEANWANYYPGRFVLQINDGNQETPAKPWWDSWDIWVTNNCYPNDLPNNYSRANGSYELGAFNKVHVVVHNLGTHPVKDFYVGATVFHSGGGGSGDPNVEQINSVLGGGKDFKWDNWDYLFIAAN